MRASLGWVSEAQTQSFNGQWTLDQIWNAPTAGYYPTNNQFGGTLFPSMQPRYMIWLYEGGSTYNWNDMLPFIRAKNSAGLTLTAPTVYPGVIT